MVYAVLEHPWPSQKRPEASRGHKSLTHIERSEIPGYKLPGWDATWGTCLEQSLCKMTPRRLKMKKRVLVKFWRKELEKSKNSKESWETNPLVRTFLKKLISRGSPEVTFCSWTKFQRGYGRSTFSKIVRKQNLIIPAAHGQLGKTDMGLSDMDSGRFGYGFWACGWFHIRSWCGLQPQNIYIYI